MKKSNRTKLPFSILKLFFKSKEISVEELDSMAINNILVVRQHNQIGDMLCSLPLFAALKKKYPQAKITLVASVTNYSIVFGDVNPFINDVLIFNKSTLLHIFRFFGKLRKTKFDLGIVPSTVSISRTSHFINYFSKAKVRAGVKSMNGKQNKTGFLLNIKSDFYWDKLKMHQTERNLDIVRQIGCDLTQDDKNKLRLGLSQKETEFAEEFFKNNCPDKNRKRIAFQPGAGKIPNRWNINNFAELMERLQKRYNPYIIINSGPIDKDVTDILLPELGKLGIEPIIIYYPIRETGAILAKSDILISNDTGTMHVAAMVNIKVIGLFGPTESYEWAPVNEHGACIQSKSKNIDDITVEEVFDKAIEMTER
ncbi:MAG: glycosyltransferase family 9 protein [Ignavibacteriae bacterium]|nr:glycosyltransferase family 9 protein [Ignavibacteriota bacterium]